MFRHPELFLVIFAVYFSAIYIGKKYMKNRKPYELKNTIRVYNIYQIIACAVFALVPYKKWNHDVFTSLWKCSKFTDFLSGTQEEYAEVFLVYWYYILLRTSELVETLFFVWRKKDSQISFLHIYHHISTVVFLWFLTKYSACKILKTILIHVF